MKIMLSFYQCYHILLAAKKGLNVGNIIYGHPAKIHSLDFYVYHRYYNIKFIIYICEYTIY
jgi:hypothetical protein